MSNFINTENSLAKKGYSENAIKEIIRWNLLNTSQEEVHIPNLKAKKRIGVTKKLSVDNLEQGYSDDFAVILKPFSRNREKIDSHNINNIDKLLQIEHSLGCSEDTKKSNSDIIKSTIKLLVEIGKEWKWDIIVFSDINSQTGHVSGKSAGSTIYLTLLSASQNIPISEKVAITGALDKKSSKIKAIGGVRGKITAAVEKGANIIIFPEENREDYDWEVPNYIKEKINEIVFVKTTKDLLDFLVNNHVCYQCRGKINDYSYFRKDEQDKKFCSDNCRTSYFETNYSKCNKCSGEIKVGDEYYSSKKSPEIKTCVSCEEVEKNIKKNKDQELAKKIDELKQQNKENEVIRKLCREIEKKIERGNYIFLTSQEEDLLGSKIVKSVKIHNKSLDEKLLKQSYQNNLEKENDDGEKYFFWLIFIIIIVCLISVTSHLNNKKKKINLTKNH